jgi:hypothetical protein
MFLILQEIANASVRDSAAGRLRGSHMFFA